MLFNSYIFLIFLLSVVPAYYILHNRYRTVFLLLCSYFFYGYWDWRFLSVLMISTIVDFVVGKHIYGASGSRRKALLCISLATNLGILGVFKYFNFFIDSFSELTATLGLPLDFLHLHIILPVGISFYTFQTLSYTIDIYRGELEPTDSFIDFAVFVAFFPQLVAGPIERAKNLLPQISLPKVFNPENLRTGFILISIGMFKKVILGDTCGRIVDHVFAEPQYYSSLELLMGLILFSMQIYNDFSGYSHIARGTAKLLGFDIMVNFRQPYFASSITDFWRRWHISLSSWLRDYLYIPLGGSRNGHLRTYRNLMLTMLLGGLWHGANWTFVMWGGLHGVFLAVHRLASKGKPTEQRLSNGSYAQLPVHIMKVVGTYSMVTFGWLFFRADNLSSAVSILQKLCAFSPSDNTARIITIITAFIFVTLMIDGCESYTRKQAFLSKLRAPYRYGILASTWLVTLLYLFQGEHMPFVYFQF